MLGTHFFCQRGTVTDTGKHGPSEASGVVFQRWVICFFIISALIKLWLVGGQTIFAIGPAIHDDRLFLSLAKKFLAHGWLGHYSHLTLIKGPFYPFWIAISFALGIPLLLSQQLLYIAACVTLIIAVRPVLRGPSMLLLLWTILLFNPMTYANGINGVMARVSREGIYPALTIFVASCAVGILVRHAYSPKALRPWAIGLGAALSALWLTREEGVWIIPMVLMIVGIYSVRIFKVRPIAWRRLLLLCALPFGILITVLVTVAGINKIGYGVFATVELKSRDFLGAYGALSRVRHAHLQPFVPVPKEARERIYAVSPAFAELRPFLEGDIGKAHTSFGCKALSVCDDIAGGWFLWAFRDAVDAAGYHSSGSSALNYYGRLAREVNAACADQRLDCGAERASLMPPWRSEYAKPVLIAMVKAGVYMVRFDGFTPYPSPSEGSEDQLILFRDMTRDRLSPGTAADRLPIQAKFDDFKTAVLGYIGKIYQIASPFAVSLALIIYIIGMVRSIRNSAVTELWMISTALLVAIVVRLCLLSMIHVISFPVISPLYLSPAYPLLLMFAVLSFADCRMKV